MSWNLPYNDDNEEDDVEAVQDEPLQCSFRLDVEEVLETLKNATLLNKIWKGMQICTLGVLIFRGYYLVEIELHFKHWKEK